MKDPEDQRRKTWLGRNAGTVYPVLVFVLLAAAALWMRMCNT